MWWQLCYGLPSYRSFGSHRSHIFSAFPFPLLLSLPVLPSPPYPPSLHSAMGPVFSAVPKEEEKEDKEFITVCEEKDIMKHKF